jgi:AcrR family transcriptional regulator
MREIAAAAGQGNHSAALYHFADKRELLHSLIERHSVPIQEGWLEALQEMAAQQRDSLEELVELLVRPVLAKLDDPDGGTEYLLIVAQLVTSRTFPITSIPVVNGPGALELTARMMRHVGPTPRRLLPLRMMRVANVLYGSIANYHMLIGVGIEISRELFVEDLVASLVAVLLAECGNPSAESR